MVLGLAAAPAQAQQAQGFTFSSLLPPLPAQTDKVLHATASAAVVDVVWAGAAACDQPLWVRIVAGVSAGVVVGVAKEGADLAGFGTADVNDLVFDGFGIGLGVAVGLLVETAVHAADRIDPGDTAVNNTKRVVDTAVERGLDDAGRVALSLP